MFTQIVRGFLAGTASVRDGSNNAPSFQKDFFSASIFPTVCAHNQLPNVCTNLALGECEMYFKYDVEILSHDHIFK